MQYSEMVKGIRYIVTHESDNSFFLLNDTIYICKDNEVYNCNSSSWLKPEDMVKSEKGLEVKVDINSLINERFVLIKQLGIINKMIKEGVETESL